MELLYFRYQNSVEEIVNKLKNYPYNSNEIFLDNKIRVKIRGFNIKLQKKRILHHPLQRIFVGKIKRQKKGTLIVGKFKYPDIALWGITFFCSVLLRGNIEMFFSDIKIMNKISATGIFAVMYIILVFFLITGKTFFKKQEDEIVIFLNNLGDSIEDGN